MKPWWAALMVAGVTLAGCVDGPPQTLSEPRVSLGARDEPDWNNMTTYDFSRTFDLELTMATGPGLSRFSHPDVTNCVVFDIHRLGKIVAAEATAEWTPGGPMSDRLQLGVREFGAGPSEAWSPIGTSPLSLNLSEYVPLEESTFGVLKFGLQRPEHGAVVSQTFRLDVAFEYLAFKPLPEPSLESCSFA